MRWVTWVCYDIRNFLGIKTYQDEDNILICQRNYATKILKNFEIFGRNPISTSIIIVKKFHKKDGGKLMDYLLSKSHRKAIYILVQQDRSYVCCKYALKIHAKIKLHTFWSCKIYSWLHSRNTRLRFLLYEIKK